MDGHGPFTVRQLRAVQQELAGVIPHMEQTEVTNIPADDKGLGLVDNLARSLASGNTLVCLWDTGKEIGHYIALVNRPSGEPDQARTIEVFDPEAADEQAGAFPPLEYVTARNYGNNANIREVIRKAVEAMDSAGVPTGLSYAPWGPQPPSTNSCGLWCLVRSALREMPPEEFFSMFRGRPGPFAA